MGIPTEDELAEGCRFVTCLCVVVVFVLVVLTFIVGMTVGNW